MLKDRMIFKFALLLALLIFAPAYILAQDLGSSNGLFNSPNPKTKSSSAKPAAKKNVAKKSTPPKKSASAPSTTAKKIVSKAKPTAKTTARAIQTADKTTPKKVAATKGNQQNTSKKQVASRQKLKTELPDKIAVKVGTPAPKTDYDQLFEQSLEAGNEARDEREYGKAEAAYLRAQSLKTKDARAVYGLGNLFSDQQRWEEAETAYRAAIQLEPDSPDAFVALSYVLTQPLSNNNLADRYTEAEKMARQAIALDPANAVAFDQLGVALELRGVISDETQNAYRRAIQLDPNFALAYAHLGRLLRRKGMSNESSAAYRSAIQLSTDVPTMILVADVMQSQQRYLESEQLLRQALRQDPKNPTGLFLLGRALTTRGSFEEAEKVLKKSAEISPNSFISYRLLGSLFLRRDKFDEAEKYLMKALKTVSPNEKKRLALDFEFVGDGFMRNGKSGDAARVYQQAFLLDSEKPALADKLAKTRKN
jgi:tetratricopeptide (TPR) repeat protein